MPNNSYSKAIEWLFTQFPSYQQIGASAYKPDLGNISALCKLIGNPEKSLQFVHIAGSNGKGSTSSMLASILTESGEKVGLFTSPHLVDFRERIRVNGEMISEKSVVEFCDLVQRSEHEIAPSFFEITLAMALLHFKNEHCSICVIETGLGGRLDATNIIQPILSIITNISLEHTQFLGNSIPEIAFEKAGIIKQHIPVLIGETHPESKGVFQKRARELDSQCVLCEEIDLKNDYQLPLLGSYQKKNLHTVLCSIDILNSKGFNISEKSIANGLNNLIKNTGIIGRMQVIADKPLIILDVSHNKDGIQKTLSDVIKMTAGILHIVYGSSSDKDYESIVNLFPNHSKRYFCTFSNQRSLSKKQFRLLNKKTHLDSPIFFNVKTAIEEVKMLAKEDDTILVFGSFFLISDFF
ncbi:MAG: bifunctional folylpolyglutamate synthase/dihydrofolate synthase [Flavobacteriia bacterium]